MKDHLIWTKILKIQTIHLQVRTYIFIQSYDFKNVRSIGIVNTGEGNSSSTIHYASVFSGPLLAIACGTFISLVPTYNVILYPNYWYLEQLTRMMCILIFFCEVVTEAVYWWEMPLSKSSCLFLFGLGVSLYASFIITYYFIWTCYLGFYPPLPYNAHICASIAYIGVVIAVWFR